MSPLSDLTCLRGARSFKIIVVAWLAISFAALLLAPLHMPAGYSWLSNTTSESAAQGVPGAWLARLGFLIFGLTVIGMAHHLRDTWSTGGQWAHTAFGVFMVSAAAFSTRAWVPEAVYDPVEDALHSFAATAMGLAFTIGVVLRFLGRGPEVCGRVLDMVAAIAATAMPLAMLALPAWDGLLQRGMFAISYLWVALEALRTHSRCP